MPERCRGPAADEVSTITSMGARSRDLTRAISAQSAGDKPANPAAAGHRLR
jgi:hypothetical protein